MSNSREEGIIITFPLFISLRTDSWVPYPFANSSATTTTSTSVTWLTPRSLVLSISALLPESSTRLSVVWFPTRYVYTFLEMAEEMNGMKRRLNTSNWSKGN